MIDNDNYIPKSTDMCFSILHYKNHEDTIECVESILFNLKNRVSIIIVDNGSDNGSFELLRDKYSNNDHIYLLHNEKNLGFAKGNNIGYSYARNVLKAQYIAVLNNDIVIDDPKMDLGIMSSYHETNFHVMGPDIISLVDQGHQNPMDSGIRDTKVVKSRMRYFKILRALNRLNLYDLFKKVYHTGESSSKERNPSKKVSEKKINVQLHGSFVIFSSDYISQQEYAFCPDTFLYGEEAILFLNCEKNGYITVYDPSLHVYHKEDSSLNFTHIDGKERREFVFSQLLSSYKVYLNILRTMGGQKR